MRGTWAARALAEAAGVAEGQTVLEIGPGTGVLTRELLARGARVIAIEKDPKLIPVLHDAFAKEIVGKRFELVFSDIRDVSPEDLGLEAGAYTLAANIPYYITGEILRMFLSGEIQPHTIALLVQKEVAVRVVAEKQSILSLSVKAFGTPRIAAKVSRGNFSPPPSVDSAILVVSNISRRFFTDTEEKTFFTLVRAGFSSKRKILAGNLATIFGSKARAEAALAACGVGARARAEDIPLSAWKKLSQILVAGGR